MQNSVAHNLLEKDQFSKHIPDNKQTISRDRASTKCELQSRQSAEILSWLRQRTGCIGLAIKHGAVDRRDSNLAGPNSIRGNAEACVRAPRSTRWNKSFRARFAKPRQRENARETVRGSGDNSVTQLVVASTTHCEFYISVTLSYASSRPLFARFANFHISNEQTSFAQKELTTRLWTFSLWGEIFNWEIV